MDQEKWVTLAEVAEHLNVHPETVRSWVLRKSMPGTKMGKVWRFKVSEVDAWVRSGGANEQGNESN